ncbi:hypothetical protein Dimus_023925 [Dionaea muscipula]
MGDPWHLLEAPTTMLQIILGSQDRKSYMGDRNMPNDTTFPGETLNEGGTYKKPGGLFGRRFVRRFGRRWDETNGGLQVDRDFCMSHG